MKNTKLLFVNNRSIQNKFPILSTISNQSKLNSLLSISKFNMYMNYKKHRKRKSNIM